MRDKTHVVDTSTGMMSAVADTRIRLLWVHQLDLLGDELNKTLSK